MPSKPTSRYPASLCAALVALCALAASPFAQYGGNDDFAYIRSAKILAETGRIVYVGWSSAMLGWQLALGAAFLKLFGFSFTAARLSMLCVAVVTAYLLHRTAARLGLNAWNATLVTLTLVLSPLYLPLSVSFMSDIPGLLAIVIAVYCCTLALDARTSRHATALLIAGSALSVVLGTARQTGWLGALIVVPCAALLMRRRGVSLAGMFAVWLLSFGAVLGCLHWFSLQMYSTAESAPPVGSANGQLYDAAMSSVRVPLELAFLVAPVLLAYGIRFFRSASVRARAIMFAGAGLAVAFFLLRLHGYWAYVLLVPAAITEGNYVTPHGILEMPAIGLRPVAFPPLWRLLASVVCYVSGAAFLALLPSTLRRKKLDNEADRLISWGQLLVLLCPLALVYLGFLSLRVVAGNLFDRYLLPLCFVLAIVAARLYQDRVTPRLPRAGFAMVAIFAIVGIAGMHDMFAANRARMQAINEVEQAGIPRSELYGGFSYDGWTQIDNQGYIDVDDIRTPSGIHHISAAQKLNHPCKYWPAEFFPTIHPLYAVSYDDISCDPQNRFAPVEYRLWLPPFHGTFYIRSVDPKRLAGPAAVSIAHPPVAQHP
jgi:hypothetical protein